MSERLSFEQIIERYTSDDIDAFVALFSDDVVWHIGGDNPFTGTHRGKEELLRVCGRFMDVSQGTLRIEAVDAMADDHYGFIMTHATAQRDGKALDVLDATFLTIGEDGRLSALWWLPNDQAAFDAFWS